MAELGDQYRDAIIVNAMLNKYTDEELTGIAGMGQEYQNLTTSLKSIGREYNETANEFNNANKAIKGFTAVASLEGYKAYTGTSKTGGNKKPEVDELQLVAADAEAWGRQLVKSRGIFDAVAGTLQPVKIPIVPDEEVFEEALPQSELEIKLRAKLENAEYAKKKIAELKELMEVATTPEEKKQLSGQVDEWAKFGGIVNENGVRQNNEYAESLLNIGGIMQTLSGITDESTAAWMNWGANTITAISQAIPAIMSLTTANTAKAASEAASSAAQIPFVGWLSAAGAALSVVAAMASIPKCANGGIAYGNSIVNVGEYAGASGNPEVIAPLSKLREYIQPHESNNASGGEVVFTISGTNLKGVLSNVERKHKKFS